MRYTKPMIVKTEEATVVIQSRNKHGQSKIAGTFQDLDFVSCTLNAYESDE